MLTFLLSIEQNKEKEMTANMNSNVAMEKLVKILSALDLSKLSRESGFVKRKPLKAEGDKFLLGFLNAVFCHQTSLMCLAFSIGQFINNTLSKVAVRKRLNSGFASFLNLILAVVLSEKLKSEKPLIESEALKSFKRVYLQDSTTISLVAKLAAFFPGSGTNNGKKAATLKIQLIYDALAESFSFFDITSFRDNDQKASALISQIAKAGDLVIRDLGYFALTVFAQLQEKEIFYLSKLKYGVNVYCKDGSSQIDLVQLIKKQLRNSQTTGTAIDIDVKVGAKVKLPTRLVVIPLPAEVANERRRKAKKNRNQRLNPGKNHLFLMGFNIFITNVERQTWAAKKLAEVYQLRWRIEIIFKSWKSNFHITSVPTSTAACVEAYIHAMLIYITLVQTYIFMPLFQMIYQKNGRLLSILKLTKLLDLLSLTPFQSARMEDKQVNIVQQIIYHAVYEKRKRISYPQMLMR